MLIFERKVRLLLEDSGLPEELDDIHVVSHWMQLLDSHDYVLGLHSL